MLADKQKFQNIVTEFKALKEKKKQSRKKQQINASANLATAGNNYERRHESSDGSVGGASGGGGSSSASHADPTLSPSRSGISYFLMREVMTGIFLMTGIIFNTLHTK